MRRNLLVTGMLAVLTACSSSSIVGPDEMVAFARAKALWDSRNFGDYTYEIRTFCFCPPEVTRWNRVLVVDGEVTMVQPVDGGPPYTPNTILLFKPIDSVFTQLHRAMTDDGFNSAYIDIDAEYDADLGFPRHIVYHEGPFVADAGLSIEIRSVSSLAVIAQRR